MNSASFGEFAKNGRWLDNPGLVLLPGLCPLLAACTSATNALGLGLAMMAVLVGTNLGVSLFRNQLSAAIRLAVMLMLMAAITTVVELVMQAYMFKLYQALGIFVTLVACNWMVLDRAGNFACIHPSKPALVDGLLTGAVCMLLMLAVGTIRELMGPGALQPVAAFLVPGLLMALGNVITRRLARSKPTAAIGTVAVGSKRARVTGRI